MNNNIFQILQNAAEFSISYFSPIVSQNFVGVTGHSRSMPEVNEEKTKKEIDTLRNSDGKEDGKYMLHRMSIFMRFLPT